MMVVCSSRAAVVVKRVMAVVEVDPGITGFIERFRQIYNADDANV